MNLFGNKPQERAMQRLIHDTNSELDRLRLTNDKMYEWIKKNHKEISAAGINTTIPFVSHEFFKTVEKEIKASIDLYYERFSKDFEDGEEKIIREPNKISIEALQKEIAWLRQQKKTAYERACILADWYRKDNKRLRESIKPSL